MIPTTTWTRTSDGKVFFEVDAPYHVEVRAKDGEEDTLKWFGPVDRYVSMTTGHTYVRGTTS